VSAADLLFDAAADVSGYLDSVGTRIENDMCRDDGRVVHDRPDV
jgi:hypothetical protein